MNKKILIIEDERRISHLLTLYFKREAYDVEVTDHGEIGLNKALQDSYDLILLDVLLPGRNGFSILEEIRKTKSTPIIMLSAQSGDANFKRGELLGANDFIAKPFSPNEVVIKAKELINQS